jgi:hypothetical protein
VTVDEESAPVLSGRTLPVVERRRGRRSRSVFRTHRPWRRRIGFLAFVTAFGVVGAAFVATVSDITHRFTRKPRISLAGSIRNASTQNRPAAYPAT